MLPITIDVEETKFIAPTPKGRVKDYLSSYLRLIISDRDTRNLFFFLLVNFSFAFTELLYGVWSNSLGLISDAFHMFFDCTGLLAGLIASIITKWKANESYSYGYSRAEILGGFINGLLLMFVSFFVFAEAVERTFEPPEVKHERLLFVSVLGLIVNLVGIFVFQHGGIGHGHSHSSHGHSHNHAHSHNGHSHGHHGHSHNHGSQLMQGVFLHILADTLGSVGVILSTILMHMFGWMIADPICSMFIAILIFLSVLNLLKSSSEVLMQRQPKELDNVLPGIYQKVMMLPGVFTVQEPHFWTLCSGQFIGNLKLEVSGATDPRYIVAQTQALFKSVGVTQLYVQLDYSTM